MERTQTAWGLLMDRGRLNRRVTFTEQEQGTNDWGEPIEIWTPIIENVPANIRAVTGREGITNGVVLTEQTVTIVCDFSPLIKNKHFVSIEGENWRISLVSPDDKYPHCFMNITAKMES
jgi:SPP1 family predicted phage head-tail adaptor